jgi:cell division initiation protein
MFTPQQIEQISFSRATFGGYDMQAVDEFLEPLTEDYVTLYKENALLKSKMRVLVGKLEEYRANEASMKDAIVNAQKTCDMMVKEAESKCTQMLNEANVAAAENIRNNDAIIAAEAERVEQAKQQAAQQIAAIEAQLQSCLASLAKIREANTPTEASKASDAAAAKQPMNIDIDMADEISQNLEALVGTAEEKAPKSDPKHPVSETGSGKFANLQFGRNYDPNKG